MVNALKYENRSQASSKPPAKLRFLTDNGGRKQQPLFDPNFNKISSALRTKQPCNNEKQKVFEKFVKSREKPVLQLPELRKPKISEKATPIVFSTLNRLDSNTVPRAQRSIRLPRDTRYDL